MAFSNLFFVRSTAKLNASVFRKDSPVSLHIFSNFKDKIIYIVVDKQPTDILEIKKNDTLDEIDRKKVEIENVNIKIEEVKKESITFPGSPTKYEAGTLQTAEVVGFSESLRFIEDVGIKNIMEHEKEILEYGLDEIKKNNKDHHGIQNKTTKGEDS